MTKKLRIVSVLFVHCNNSVDVVSIDQLHLFFFSNYVTQFTYLKIFLLNTRLGDFVCFCFVSERENTK